MRDTTRPQNLTVVPGESAVDIGIVILNYNTVDLLRQCLRTVCASTQMLRSVVYVVDNASTDGSAEMVAREFPDVHLLRNRVNVGYSAGNNVALRRMGFTARMDGARSARREAQPGNRRGIDGGDITHLPRYVVLLNPDTLVPLDAFEKMVQFCDDAPEIGVAGPRVRRPDGSLDRACRRSYPTPMVSFYRMTGLSRVFPHSKRFNAYNLDYLAEDAVHPVDAVVGAFMMVRREAILDAGLLDERFFMYGEDLDWAKRMKDAGWQVWYNGQVEITHVKEAASSQSSKSRIDFYEAMWIFYRKHYRRDTSWLLDKLIMLAIVLKGSADVGRHLWRYCRSGGEEADGTRAPAAGVHGPGVRTSQVDVAEAGMVDSGGDAQRIPTP